MLHNRLGTLGWVLCEVNVLNLLALWVDNDTAGDHLYSAFFFLWDILSIQNLKHRQSFQHCEPVLGFS